MGEVYALRLRGSSGVDRIRAEDGQSAQEVFNAAVAARGIKPDGVSSFYRAARSIPVPVSPGSRNFTGRLVPGEELILQVRGLPELSEDATMVHAGWFNGDRCPAIDPKELALTERAAAALEELQDAGLSTVETFEDGRYCHVLTYEGLARPAMQLPRAKYGIPFRMVERASLEAEAKVVEEDHGMSGP